MPWARGKLTLPPALHALRRGKVPISLVYRTDLAELDGSAPALLDGYGSYEVRATGLRPPSCSLMRLREGCTRGWGGLCWPTRRRIWGT